MKKPRALTRDTRQTGTSNMRRDLKRKAIAPGKRISKNGNIYYENRKNRSDVRGRDTPRRMFKRKLLPRITKRTTKTTLVRKPRISSSVLSREPLRGVRKHDLLPRFVRAKLPKLYSQEGNKNPMVYLKLFSPYSSYTLYVTEFDGKDTFFGYVKNGMGSEWGYSSFKELATANRNGLPLVERDMYFTPKKFKDIKN